MKAAQCRENITAVCVFMTSWCLLRWNVLYLQQGLNSPQHAQVEVSAVFQLGIDCTLVFWRGT